MNGPQALDPNLVLRNEQIKQSDVNADQIPLSVGDFCYLLRVIVGDDLPYPKLHPFRDRAYVSISDDTLKLQSDVKIGALWATFRIDGDYDLANLTAMQVETGRVSDSLNVLVYSGLADMHNALSAGAHSLFTISGNPVLIRIQVSDYDGNMMVPVYQR